MGEMPAAEWKIQHDYEIALRNLNPEGWARMALTEKVENLQAIENKNAFDMNRVPAELRAEPLPAGEIGYQQGNSIVFSSHALQDPDFMESVDTAYHEGSHVRDWQAMFLPEVRAGYAPEDLAARSTPIPEPQADWEGYWNHPAEQAAREAGAAGVEKTLQEQARIAQVDQAVHEEGPVRNQILETYDYIALQESSASSEDTLESAASSGWDSAEAFPAEGDTSAQADLDSYAAGAAASDGLDAAETGADASLDNH